MRALTRLATLALLLTTAGPLFSAPDARRDDVARSVDELAKAIREKRPMLKKARIVVRTFTSTDASATERIRKILFEKFETELSGRPEFQVLAADVLEAKPQAIVSANVERLGEHFIVDVRLAGAESGEVIAKSNLTIAAGPEPGSDDTSQTISSLFDLAYVHATRVGNPGPDRVVIGPSFSGAGHTVRPRPFVQHFSGGAIRIRPIRDWEFEFAALSSISRPKIADYEFYPGGATNNDPVRGKNGILWRARATRILHLGREFEWSWSAGISYMSLGTNTGGYGFGVSNRTLTPTGSVGVRYKPHRRIRIDLSIFGDALGSRKDTYWNDGGDKVNFYRLYPLYPEASLAISF